MKSKIKIFITDCDGCLTDGGMYYDQMGNELKKFNSKDGKGFELLRNNNILTGIITGENTKIVENRAKKIKIEELHQGATNKLEVLKEILERRNLKFEEVAYVGDDVNDLEMIKNCGITFAPNDAVDDVLNSVDVVLKKNGGQGAVREAIDYVIKLNSEMEMN